MVSGGRAVPGVGAGLSGSSEDAGSSEEGLDGPPDGAVEQRVDGARVWWTDGGEGVLVTEGVEVEPQEGVDWQGSSAVGVDGAVERWRLRWRGVKTDTDSEC